MLVAHTSPVGGIFNVSEYLTAPLFALLIGVGLRLSWRSHRGGLARFWVHHAVRGLLLIPLGSFLQTLYGQIAVVLQTLGVLLILLAPAAKLARLTGVTTLAAAMAVVAPLVMTALRDLTVAGGLPGWLVLLLDWVATGQHYRALSFMVFGLVGIALVIALDERPDLASGMRGFGSAAVLGLTAGAVYWGGKQSGLGHPYSGTTPELVGGSVLAAGVALGSAWLVSVLGDRAGRVLEPLIDTGRLALSAYTLQIVILAVLEVTVFKGERDDQWWVLGLLIVACVGFSWAWSRHLGIGPMERLLRLPDVLLASR